MKNIKQKKKTNNKEKRVFKINSFSGIVIATVILSIIILCSFGIGEALYRIEDTIRSHKSVTVNNEKIDMLSCPYCGKSPSVSSNSSKWSSSGMYYYVECNNDDHDIQFESDKSMKDAIEKWNLFVDIIDNANNN